MVEKVLKLYCDTNFQLFTILNRDEDLFYNYRKIVFGDKRDYKRMIYYPSYLVKITSNNDNKNRLFYLEISVAMLRYNLAIIEHKIIKTFIDFNEMMDYLNEKFLNNVFNLHELNNKIRKEKLDKLNKDF